MNREVHVRIWERPEVRVLWATRHEGQFPPPRLSGRSAFSEETFAGRCGNEKRCAIPDLPALAPERADSAHDGSRRGSCVSEGDAQSRRSGLPGFREGID